MHAQLHRECAYCTFKLAGYCVQHHTLGIPVLHTIVTIRSVRGKVQTSSYIMRLIQVDGPKKKSQIHRDTPAGIDHSSGVFFCVYGPTGSLLQFSCKPERESETSSLTAFPDKGKPTEARQVAPRGLPNITIVPIITYRTVWYYVGHQPSTLTPPQL